jgi:hypothetical protein
MAGSYFELITEQDGLPAETFDPIRELKRLRRSLDLRLQSPQVADVLRSAAEPTAKNADSAAAGEPLTLESVAHQVATMKRTLSSMQHSRPKTKPNRTDLYRGKQKFRNKKDVSVNSDQMGIPQLEITAMGLTALGLIGLVFGGLCLLRGWESDLSIGYPVSLSGLTIIAVGLGGRFFADQ